MLPPPAALNTALGNAGAAQKNLTIVLRRRGPRVYYIIIVGDARQKLGGVGLLSVSYLLCLYLAKSRKKRDKTCRRGADI